MQDLPTWLIAISLLLFLSSYVKIFTTLSILRFGIGIDGAGFGLIIAGVSVVLSLLVIRPILNPVTEKTTGPEKSVFALADLKYEQVESKFRPFLEKHADQALTLKLQQLSKKVTKPATVEQVNPQAAATQATETINFEVLCASFLLTELKQAFQLGFLLLLPFLVIDLLVTNVLMLLGITQLPAAAVSLPLKLLLFFAIDGWALISEKLITSYIS